MIRLKLHWQRLHHYISDCVLCFTVYQRNLHLSGHRFCFFVLKNKDGEHDGWVLLLCFKSEVVHVAFDTFNCCCERMWDMQKRSLVEFIQKRQRYENLLCCFIQRWKNQKKNKNIEPNLNIISQNKVVSTLHVTCTVIDKISIKY